MKRACFLIVVALATGMAIPVNVDAKPMKKAPTRTALLSGSEPGQSRVALLFDLSGLAGRTVQTALIDWQVSGVPSQRRSEYFLHVPGEAWTSAGVGVSGRTVTLEVEPTAVWDIEVMDYQRVGGFLRFDVTGLVRDWLSGTPNNGVVMVTSDVSGQTLQSQAGGARLIVRFSPIP
jgi:hypothetical protein